MAEVISNWPVTMEFQVQSQVSHVIFVVDRVALGQVFVRLLRYSCISIVPPMSHTYFHLQAPHRRRTIGQCLGIFKLSNTS